ncbi:hypothetical protein [Halomarina rubra]|uniref:Peptidase M10A and M12B matrixin and adamalysin n=1 Tax=Halomarina rubra TaxID=2071873 RepID=A0ABD6AV77_9EURY|nr:hypothetical protein [Halomarina rubra]
MRRREFLLGGGVVGTLGAVGVVTTLVGELEVRWWATPRAAQYEALRERVTGYLERGLDGLALSVDVSHGGVVSVPTENAHRLVADGAWPRRLLTGGVGGTVDPATDVNLLVTDSSMRRSPTGAGIPYVAAVGGARHVARAPPATDVEDVVPDRFTFRTIQILVHECGHALGLRHDHGTIRDDGAVAVVSPMVSGYAWADGPLRREQFDFDRNRCGRPYPSVRGREPRLRLGFDDCERHGVTRFRRPGLPTLPVGESAVDDLLALARSLPTCATCLDDGERSDQG